MMGAKLEARQRGLNIKKSLFRMERREQYLRVYMDMNNPFIRLIPVMIIWVCIHDHREIGLFISYNYTVMDCTTLGPT